MASLRGTTQLWQSAAVAANGVSAAAYVPGPNVVIFVDNEGTNSHTFKVQVAFSDSAGLNDVDNNTVWYDYMEKDMSAAVEVTVGNGENKAIDLSPFAPQVLRLFCTAGTSNNVSARVAWVGPN